MGQGKAKPYQITLRKSALKEIQRLPKDVVKRVRRTIDALANDALPRGAEKLVGGKNIYRLRVGDYRLIYHIDFDKRWVTIERVKHRREAYR